MATLLQRNKSWLVLIAMLLATAALYWRGLHGPFLLDDPFALQSLAAWQEGKQPLWQVLFSNESLLWHRSLAMATLVVNVLIGGDSTFSFKAGNLLHHLAAGLFIYLLVNRMFLRDNHMATRARVLALLVTALWLMHPLHVSTVLYVIQRMAQVAAVCCVIGMWLYMLLRSRIEAGTLRAPTGWLLIWIVIPAMTFLGIQGKQNAAILPVLCLVLELAYFSSIRSMPAALRVFYALAVAIPGLLTVVALVTGADTIYLGYWAYNFDMGERLLSEARALWVFVADTLAPYPPGMGIYGDDFEVSRGLLSPPTTLISILALIAVSALVVRCRQMSPSLFAGWFLFLVGHSVESSFLPLELYYEHRNYLPSVGLLICVVSLASQAIRWLSEKQIHTGRIVGITVVAALATLMIQTGGRVHVWKTLDTILSSSVEAHPESLHANYAYLNALMGSKHFDEADRRIAALVQSPNKGLRAGALMYKLALDCARRRNASPQELREVMRLVPQDRIELTTLQALNSLVDNAERGPEACGELTFKILADELRKMADRAADQPTRSYTLSTMRNLTARLYLTLGDTPIALEQARLSWHSLSPPSYSAPLIRALVLDGRIPEAEAVLADARQRARSFNQFDQDGLARMQDLIDSAKEKAQTPLDAPQRAPPSSH